ncbi:hypothetical protein J2S19_001445 [Metabacillus malikii]|uniref:Uncharacterized protein n=1 Tax=Metabacillus malikii TaxID=1504265 RepID=A0ABT9ZF47_9BACI|nr:hypothetical protein [Metabacillus malikii]
MKLAVLKVFVYFLLKVNRAMIQNIFKQEALLRKKSDLLANFLFKYATKNDAP